MSNKHSEPISEVVYLRKEETYFTDETIQSLKELGDVLRSIHNRLIAEGYTIKDGKIYKEDVIQA